MRADQLKGCLPALLLIDTRNTYMKLIIQRHLPSAPILRLALLCLLLLGGFMSTASAEEITVDGTRRNYIVYVPSNLGKDRPLLISCHGMNQDAAYQRGMLQIESVADTAKFVTVFPNGIDKSWDISGDKDIRYILALIDEMERKYSIDRNCVYLSGFSMGGMFTYHAMTRIADKIAAFAPISGYPMWGGSYTSSRPVPIIHTHGTSDDVVGFSGVASVLAGWVKRNGCPTKAKVQKPYRANHITRHTWGPGENGVEVVLMEMADKGHWISNDNGVKTGDEIWKFCKRFSLNQKDPIVRITSPRSEMKYITYGGPTIAEPFTVEATAKPRQGNIVKVAFYHNSRLLGEDTEAPYTCVVESLEKGKNVISAVATDDEGNTGSSETTAVCLEPNSYVFTNFNEEGCVPEGWTTSDSQEQRTGYDSGFTTGCRVFQFTGNQHDFDFGLYARNMRGKAKEGYARFADKSTTYTLTLYPGNYQILSRVANWNRPALTPVTIALETIDGQTVYAETFPTTVNIGCNTANDFTGVATNTMTFDVNETGRYVVTFYTADTAWADLVLGRAALRRLGEPAGISTVATEAPVRYEYYNLQGQRTTPSASGLYIQKSVMPNGKSHSRVVLR